MSECPELERTAALADGELTGDEAEAARAHLATCATCQAELGDILQLDALPPPRAVGQGGKIISLAWYRRRSVQFATIVLAAAAGVAIYVATGKRGPVPAPEAPRLALAEKRTIEARLSWDQAREYRPYDVPRAGEPPREAIPFATLAEVEKRGDLHGVGVLAMLDGERKQAAGYLERAGETADVLADRAALALADAQPTRALALCDAALGNHPDHSAAQWNRGLALRDLGLVRGAAAMFHAVAARGERGWADEAGKRASALDAEADALEQRFARLNQASVALASGKLEMSVDDARAEPGYARGILYDAIRSAPGADRLAQLEPLADAIDASDHDTALKDAIARAKAALHPELANKYADMIRALSVEARLTQPTGNEPALPQGLARAQWLAQLRAAHANDLLIGVMMKLADDRSTVNDTELAEFGKLTAASPDPWMQMIGLQQQAQSALNHEDLVGAEAVLLRARQRCSEGAPMFRCIIVGKLIGTLYLKWLRIPEARAVLRDAFALSRKAGESFLQADLMNLLARLAVVDSDAEGSNLPLVRAYTDEMLLRFPKGADDWKCQTAAFGRTLRAQVLINQLQFAAARRELAGPACAKYDDPAQAADLLFTRAELAQQGGSPDEITAVRADIAALRAQLPANAPEHIRIDHAEGRVVIDRDPAAGEALLRRAISAAQRLPASAVQERKPAAWSYAVLAVADAKRGDANAMLSVLAEEQGVELPNACVLGLAVDDQHRAIAARDAAGKPLAHHDDGRTKPVIAPASFVPADIASALAGCAVVDVIARAPLHGMSRLLPDTVAWRYLSRRAAPLPVTPPLAKRIAIADVEPPAALELPRLQSWSSDGEQLAGPQATPSRVLAAIASAGEVIVHAHGIVDVAQPDASYLALSPDADGKFALTTGDVRKAKLAAPLIILAACRASRAAPIFHDTWSLPAAFVYAGARAVIASAAPIPDADAGAFFDVVRTKVHAGVPVALAVRDARREWIEERRGDWVRDVIVFE